jgi:hypothetical protein
MGFFIRNLEHGAEVNVIDQLALAGNGATFVAQGFSQD